MEALFNAEVNLILSNLNKCKSSDWESIIAWLEKIGRTSTGDCEAPTKLDYLKYLFHLVNKGALHYPFTEKPPCSPIPPLKDYFMKCQPRQCESKSRSVTLNKSNAEDGEACISVDITDEDTLIIGPCEVEMPTCSAPPFPPMGQPPPIPPCIPCAPVESSPEPPDPMRYGPAERASMSPGQFAPDSLEEQPCPILDNRTLSLSHDSLEVTSPCPPVSITPDSLEQEAHRTSRRQSNSMSRDSLDSPCPARQTSDRQCISPDSLEVSNPCRNRSTNFLTVDDSPVRERVFDPFPPLCSTYNDLQRPMTPDSLDHEALPSSILNSHNVSFPLTPDSLGLATSARRRSNSMAQDSLEVPRSLRQTSGGTCISPDPLKIWGDSIQTPGTPCLLSENSHVPDRGFYFSPQFYSSYNLDAFPPMTYDSLDFETLPSPVLKSHGTSFRFNSDHLWRSQYFPRPGVDFDPFQKFEGFLDMLREAVSDDSTVYDQESMELTGLANDYVDEENQLQCQMDEPDAEIGSYMQLSNSLRPEPYSIRGAERVEDSDLDTSDDIYEDSLCFDNVNSEEYILGL